MLETEAQMFYYETTVRMHDVDPAGLVYFANIPKLAHTAYEAYLDSTECNFNKLVHQAHFALPIVHLEADYHLPIYLGNRLTIQLFVERVGDTSFTLLYRLLNDKGLKMATVKTVHVSVEKHTLRPIPLPEEIECLWRLFPSESASKP